MITVVIFRLGARSDQQNRWAIRVSSIRHPVLNYFRRNERRNWIVSGLQGAFENF